MAKKKFQKNRKRSKNLDEISSEMSNLTLRTKINLNGKIHKNATNSNNISKGKLFF